MHATGSASNHGQKRNASVLSIVSSIVAVFLTCAVLQHLVNLLGVWVTQVAVKLGLVAGSVSVVCETEICD